MSRSGSAIETEHMTRGYALRRRGSIRIIISFAFLAFQINFLRYDVQPWAKAGRWGYKQIKWKI